MGGNHEDIVNRLRRVEGQVTGIRRMQEDHRCCIDVLDQISAARAGFEATALLILRDHVDGCVREAIEEGKARRRRPSSWKPSAVSRGVSDMNDRNTCSARGLTRALISLGVIAFVFVPMSAALAHAGEEADPALTSVQVAIAVIRSQPVLMDVIGDKIGDAIESEDAEGVDIAKVEEAQKAFEDGDLNQTELLLEQAVGACPGDPVITPREIRWVEPITKPCPAPAHLTALDRIPVAGTTRPVLLSFAALAIMGGLFLVRRTHGHAD